MPSNLETIVNILPQRLKLCFFPLREKQLGAIREIRLTAGKPVIADLNGESSYIGFGGLVSDASDAYIATGEDIYAVLNNVCKSSLYAYENQIRQGFVTLPGGHRVGIAGTGVYSEGELKNIKDICALCIRVASCFNQWGFDAVKRIIRGGSVADSVIVGMPKSGKTTLVRSVSRALASFERKPIIKVGIIDQRFEIASSMSGKNMLDTGENSFVVSGVTKAHGTDILVRGFSPDVIIMDEVWSDEDIKAVHLARGAGAKVICTRHGNESAVSNALKELGAELAIYIDENHCLKYFEGDCNAV